MSPSASSAFRLHRPPAALHPPGAPASAAGGHDAFLFCYRLVARYNIRLSNRFIESRPDRRLYDATRHARSGRAIAVQQISLVFHTRGLLGAVTSCASASEDERMNVAYEWARTRYPLHRA
ncbi:hypothetical protein EVAR_15830_1 [Eumeta japonica]|uniref:Uncharacterized protein n=1 Tax=Eumeta variegata TaxID=151549 RepID=A0A4C1UFC6_EUMVA|nr:hypothetical protein EVAR_15830_1 [Eumeta japonica]